METPAIYGIHMKKVINNSVYDTTKAKLIGQWQTTHDPGTNEPCQAVYQLYKTKSGKYFIFFYVKNQSDSDMFFPTKQITPVTASKAEQLCKEMLPYTTWAEEFVFTGKKNVSAVISEALARAIDKEREKTGKTVSAIISDALTEALLK